MRNTRGWLVGVLMVSCLLGAGAAAADSVCQEAQDILGIGLQPASEETHPAAPSLLITEVAPLSQAERIGLRAGDLIEQVNSWRTPDCESYQQAVQDAREAHKALLLLISRKEQHHALVFEPEIWPRKEPGVHEHDAMVTLQSIVAVPLAPELKEQIRPTAQQVLTILREVAAVAVLPGDPAAYAQRVDDARTQLAARAAVSANKTEGQVLTAAQVVLRYYAVTQEIRAYQQTLGSHAAKGDAPRRNPASASSGVPYLLNSPVAGWLEQYPFLRASVRQSPQKLSFIEREGRWDPNQAVQLLWQRAQAETEMLAQWLQG